MANKTFNTRVKNKRDTAANWEAVATTFQPLDGELIIVDTSAGKTRFKVGRYDAAKGRLLYYNEIPFTDEYLYNDLNESQGKIYDKLKSIDEREPLIGTTNTLAVEQVKTAILAGRPVVISYTDATYGELKFTNFAYSTVEDTIVSDMIAYYSDYGYILGELIGTNQWSFKTTVIAERSDMSQFATKEYVDNGLDVKASKDVATTSANGLMSSTDKAKLNGIAEGANRTTVDTALSTTSTNPVQNKVIKSALDGKLSTSGGTLTGNLTGKYITGTWLQTTDASELSTTPTKIPVLDSTGWIYYRTLEHLKSDLGVGSGATGNELQYKGEWISSGNYQANDVVIDGSGKFYLYTGSSNGDPPDLDWENAKPFIKETGSIAPGEAGFVCSGAIYEVFKYLLNTTTSDTGKFLRVNSAGKPAWESVPSGEGVNF